MLTLTETARTKFLEIAEAEGKTGAGLRVIVRNGGTAQPEFALNFVAADAAAEDDTVIDVGGFNVYCGADSVQWLEGATIDFLDTIHESGFKVDAPNAGIPKPSGPVAEAVQAILEEQINPAVASHGGFVALIAIEDDTAYLQFGGGCQGCGMIDVTLKQGVEKVLFEHVPEIKKVMDITDHAAGTNPYYSPAK